MDNIKSSLEVSRLECVSTQEPRLRQIVRNGRIVLQERLTTKYYKGMHTDFPYKITHKWVDVPLLQQGEYDE